MFEKEHKLQKFVDERLCVKCPLNGKVKVPWEIEGFTFYEHIKTVRPIPDGYYIVFVGEAPGETEEAQIKPFVGKAGKLLRSIINTIRNKNPEFSNLKIMITNACKCKPTDKRGSIRAPSVEEINICKKNLINDLNLIKPVLIVALGKSASVALEVPEASKKLEALRGCSYQTKYGKVFVTYHPSAVIRNRMKNFKIFEHDLINAFKIAYNSYLSLSKLDQANSNVSDLKFITKVITQTEELLEEWKKFKTLFQTNNAVITAFDYETVPFSWEFFPKFDIKLANLGIDPFSELSHIAYVSIAYKNNSEIYSFSFPVKAYTMMNKIKDYIANKIDKFKEEASYIVEKISKISSTYDKNTRESLKMKLFFLYQEYGFISQVIEDIENVILTSKSELEVKVKVSRFLKDVTASYISFLAKVEQFINEYEKVYRIDENLAEKILRKYLTERAIYRIAQNPQFEISFSIMKFGIEPLIGSGTDILDYLLGYNTHALEELEKRYLHDSIIGFVGKRESFKRANQSLKDFSLYNALDSAKTLAIYFKESEIIKTFKDKKVYNSYTDVNLTHAIKCANEFISKIIIPFSVHAYLNGLKIDLEKNIELTKKVYFYINQLLEKIEKKTGTKNIRTDEFREILFELTKGQILLTGKSNKPSISEEALKFVYENAEDKSLKELVIYVHSVYKYEGLLSRYLEKYPFYINLATGRIHPKYNPTKTATGRLSCSDPNIQQIPREPFKSCTNCYVVPFDQEKDICPICEGKLNVLVDFREVFVSDPRNCLIMADYSQIEMAILAELSKDENLITAINNKLDMHSYNASNVYKVPYEEIVEKKKTDQNIARLRQNAKKVTFAVIYGASEEGISSKEKIGIEEAREIIEVFYSKHPNTKTWINRMHNEALEKGVVLVPTGRPRWFPESLDLMDENTKNLIKRRAQNTPIQGFASDINLITCEILRKKYGLKVIGAIHDSILIEESEDKVSEIETKIQNALIDTIKLRESLIFLGLKFVPKILNNLSVLLNIETKIGKTWKEIK